MYRVAGWRQPVAIGAGRLVVRVHGPGSARLSYRNPDGEGRAECVRRQTWILRVPASCGASRATLREEGCLAQGDPACQYVVTWSEDVRLVPTALVGMLVAVVLSVTALATAAPTVWLLVPVAMAATYAVERWRIARANPLAIAQSSAAFRWLIGRALDAPTTEAAEQHAGAPPLPGPGVSIEPEGDVWLVA